MADQARAEEPTIETHAADVTAALQARMLVRLAADPTAADGEACSTALQAARLIVDHDLVIMTRGALEIARRGGRTP